MISLHVYILACTLLTWCYPWTSILQEVVLHPCIMLEILPCVWFASHNPKVLWNDHPLSLMSASAPWQYLIYSIISIHIEAYQYGTLLPNGCPTASLVMPEATPAANPRKRLYRDWSSSLELAVDWVAAISEMLTVWVSWHYCPGGREHLNMGMHTFGHCLQVERKQR